MITGARIFACAMACLLLSSCTSIHLDESLDDHSREVARLRQELLEDPQSDVALRDLGSIYMRTGDAAGAKEYLQRAYALGNRDAKTLFFLGLANENTGEPEAALRIYQSYVEVSTLSPYRRLMQGRYSWLAREVAHVEMRQRISEETAISDTEISSDVIAIFPLFYLGEEESYRPLGRGLAEMITVDLQNVNQIRVVERSRLQALLDELELGTTDHVNQASAPRLGRLLRAGRIVGGTYNVLPGEELRLDASYVETITSELNDLAPQSDALANFFRLEKQIVFSLLSELGIELTEAEQIQIERVPTQNLQAFLAYSRGLVEEDNQNYEAAARSFQQATAIDPSFSSASVRSEEASSLVDAAGASSSVLESAIGMDPMIGPPIDLMASRIDQLGAGVGLALPGPDSRNTTEDAGVIQAVLLPTPPRPPGQNKP